MTFLAALSLLSKPRKAVAEMEKNRCEFCSQRRKTASTVFNGFYCIECYETMIEASKDAIKEIKAKKGGEQK